MLKLLKGDKEFWGPISITLGVIVLANTLLSTSYIALINGVMGIALFIFGFCIMPKNAKIWIRVAIPAGLTIFSSGIRLKSIASTLGWVGSLWWILVLIGICLMIVGFIRYSLLERKTK